MTVTPSQSTYTMTDHIVIGWSAATDAKSYGLTVRRSPYNSDATLVFDRMVYGNSQDIGTLSAGTYRVRMRSYNDV